MGDAYLREHPNPHRTQYRSPRREEPSGVIGVHTAENLPDTVATDGGAEAVARFISGRRDPGSYHELCDSDSFINLVRWLDEAFHDGTGTNPHSFGLSAATTAAWWPLAPRAWRDGCIENMAQRAAAYARWLHARRGIVIPARRITEAQARARVPGFVAHAQLDPGRRSDPGEFFPWAQFLARYAELIADLLGGTPPSPNPEDPMDQAQYDKLMGEVEAARQEANAARAAAMIAVAEGRQHYGSLRGWMAAIAERLATVPMVGTTFAKLRTRAGELDTHTHPDQ